MTSPKPSLALLRSLSDEAVLRALMAAARLTRAQLAAATGLSKPTAAEAIRRLELAGLVYDTGERTTGRGGVGSFYALTETAGVALAVSIAPDGLVVELVDAAGTVRRRSHEAVRRPATSAVASRLLRATVRAALQDRGPESVRVAVVSAADPVERATGALVQLPDAPFLLGEWSPAAVLSPFVAGPVIVDNDVNWSARAERSARLDEGRLLDDFAYLHLGEGLGCAVVADGEVRRGHRGIAGEIAHVPVPGPDGRAVELTQVFDELGLRRQNSAAVDVDRVLTALHSSGRRRLVAALVGAVCAVLTALIAFLDPEMVVLGGPWGTEDKLLAALRDALGRQPRSVLLDRARVTEEPALRGARGAAVTRLRADIVNRIGGPGVRPGR